MSIINIRGFNYIMLCILYKTRHSFYKEYVDKY